MNSAMPHVQSSPRAHLVAPATASLRFVLPFMILELMNRGGPLQDFPIPLFVLMWLLGFSFILILTATRRSLRTPDRRARVFKVLPGVVAMILVAWFWISLVVDQMPCFLGVPNCD
jgi:hypothetical protein